MWNWDNLPESEYSEAIRMYNADDTDGLYDLHVKYKLSTYEYCCGIDEAMRNHFYDGIYIKKIICETKRK